MSVIGIEDIRAAAARLKGRIHRTPVVTSRSFDERCGHQVFFKCENLQRAGAFKIRGALNKLLTLTDEERNRGVVGFSSGNHAQGVALAARLTGSSAMILMPTDAPALKVAATRGYGAEVVFYDRQTEDREERARGLVSHTGRVLVPPYDDPAIMAGQGTAALELLEDVPELDALVTPMGGGALTFPINRRTVTEVLLVSDTEIAEAVRFLLLRGKVLVEPTGAVPAAALLAGKVPLPTGSKVGVILSGGNIDPELLARILAGNN